MSRVFLAGNFGHSFFPTKEAFDVLWILFKTTVQRAILKFSALYAFHELRGKQLSGFENKKIAKFSCYVSLWIFRNPFRKHYAGSKFEVLCSGFASGIAFTKQLCFKKLKNTQDEQCQILRFWKSLSDVAMCNRHWSSIYIYRHTHISLCIIN